MEQLYKVKNPTSEDIAIQFKGVFYTLPADGELENISKELKEFWNSLHEFLFFQKQPTSAKQVVEVEEVAQTGMASLEEKLEELKEEVEEEVEDVKEEVKEVKVKVEPKPKKAK